MSNYSTREYNNKIDITDLDKLKIIFDNLPETIQSIMDIGCGNGFYTNEFAKKFNAIGVDLNPNKLKFVQGQSIEASCDNIPFQDQVDLVFSSEMLEHLPDKVLRGAIKEFNRIAKSYIMVSVPYKEDLHKLVVQCPECKKKYHKNNHLHSFDLKSLLSLFPDWQEVSHFLIDPKIRGYNKYLAQLKHFLVPSKHWIPSFWVKKQNINISYCMHCNAKNEINGSGNFFANSFDYLNAFLAPKRPSQILLLLERKSPTG